MKQEFSYFYLTCDEGQKEAIAQTLLEKKLIVCAKFLPIDAMYWWEGKIERANEVMIIMEAPSDNFTKIESAVASIHAYDTFVLTQVEMKNINDDAKKWVAKELES